MESVIASSVPADLPDPEKADHLEEVTVDLNFDRTTPIFRISGEEYLLVLNNCNIYDMQFKVKSAAEILQEGVIEATKKHQLKVSFKPTVGQRQYLLINYCDTTRSTSSPTISILVDKISE